MGQVGYWRGLGAPDAPVEGEMSSVLYTPHGAVNLSRETVSVPPEYLKMLAVMADTSADIGIGLHCTKCKQDIRGANSGNDARWTVECGCRTFSGRNPFNPSIGQA